VRLRRTTPKIPPTIRQKGAASPNSKKAAIRHAVKVLAHMKSPRTIAPKKLSTDEQAKAADVLCHVMPAMLSGLLVACKTCPASEIL